ncbi:MAG: ATP-binding cassette domain-containing protein [Bacteroidaceae bacterium]|nr:ATP-binding cassette domain-containing protein [Bacteroidaceae bacterium]
MLIEYNKVSLNHGNNPILKNIDFKMDEGEFIFIIGSVGTGKTSFLKSIYNELEIADGKAMVLGYDMSKMSHKKLPYLRRQCGIVFQDFKLLTDRTVYDNLAFVLKATDWKKENIDARISEVLKSVGMEGKQNMRPHELSGGEQQRIAIARAILNKPKIIIADEPTGNLDAATGLSIVKLLQEIVKNSGTSVIMSTHNLGFLQEVDNCRVYSCEKSEFVDVSHKYTQLIHKKPVVEEKVETKAEEEEETPIVYETSGTAKDIDKELEMMKMEEIEPAYDVNEKSEVETAAESTKTEVVTEAENAETDNSEETVAEEIVINSQKEDDDKPQTPSADEEKTEDKQEKPSETIRFDMDDY